MTRTSTFIVLAIAVLAPLGYFLGVEEVSGSDAPPLFAGWPKPDLAIVISGQMHGYLQRCGCSDPQYGGLDRRYNFIKSLRDKGWPTVAIDVGNLAPPPGLQPDQAELKFAYTMKALATMSYSAVGLGKGEFNMPLFRALGCYTINNPEPAMLVANAQNVQALQGMNVRRAKVIAPASPAAPQLCVLSVIDGSVQREITDKVDGQFLPPTRELALALKEANAPAAINILLYHGSDGDAELGRLLAGLPQIPVAVCISANSEPPSTPHTIKGTKVQAVINVGHKGRYVGVLALFRATLPLPRGGGGKGGGAGYEFRYQLVPIGPEYADRPGTQNPVTALLNGYCADVARLGFIDRFPRGRHPLQMQYPQTKYAGSDTCGNCHESALKVWQATPHAFAFEALAKARPGPQNSNGECVVCHTVGFAYDTGYRAKGNNDARNQKLRNVGCECCHGPAADHANNCRNASLYPAINPLSTRHFPVGIAGNAAQEKRFVSQQLRAQDDFCQKCHDPDNDVNWGKVSYLEKWHRIEH